MTTPEGKVKAKIKRTMRKNHPGSWSFMPVQMGYGQHGIPDHIYCVPMTIRPEHVGKTIGVFLGIEAKAGTGRLSRHQEKQLKDIREATGLAFVVRGVGERFNIVMARLNRLICGT